MAPKTGSRTFMFLMRMLRVMEISGPSKIREYFACNSEARSEKVLCNNATDGGRETVTSTPSSVSMSLFSKNWRRPLVVKTDRIYFDRPEADRSVVFVLGLVPEASEGKRPSMTMNRIAQQY